MFNRKKTNVMKKIYFQATVLIIMSTFLITCKKEKEAENKEQEVSFAINMINSQNTSSLKSSSLYKLSDVKKAVLTIQQADGTPTNYTSADVKIYQMNGVFFSQKLTLKTGAYRLTEFLLKDSANNTIFATPLAGSQEAQNVIHPLPVSFSVAKDSITPVNIEVLSTANKTPGDFGLAGFQIKGKGLLNYFLISLADKVSNRLLSGKITISDGRLSYVQNLDSIVNNVVPISDSLSYYVFVTIEKNGYDFYLGQFTVDSLKWYSGAGSHIPLLVELVKDDSIYGTMTDIDGNVYKTVKIFGKTWMAENLKVMHFRNGDSINGTVVNERGNTVPEAVYDYNNDPANSANYGKLYNWYVITDKRNIAPAGWHVTTPDEWFMFFVNGNLNSGMLKETGTAHWLSPNTGATNITGFTALPGGYRGSTFFGLGTAGLWWTTEYSPPDFAFRISMNFNSLYFQYEDVDATAGCSIRCVKDN
jgi:uncharacterized protein (TIGR02145 family)